MQTITLLWCVQTTLTKAATAETKEGLVMTSGQTSGNNCCCPDKHHHFKGVRVGVGGGGGVVLQRFKDVKGLVVESETADWLQGLEFRV